MTKTLSLAEFRRDMAAGATLTLVSAPTMPDHKYLGIPRKAVRVGSSNMRLDGGSYLDIPRASLCEYSDTDGIRTFSVSDDLMRDENMRGNLILSYTITL